MSIRGNRYFNDPGIAQAAGNLASLFAPPSGADAAGWAAASAKKAEAARLADLFSYVNDPNFDQSKFDRMGVAAGTFAPTQSYYAVDQSNATSRSNNAADNTRALQDRSMQEAGSLQRLYVTDATSRANNAADNQRSALTSLYQPLNPGQVAPAVPAELMDAVGLPAIDQRAGVAKPLSETEWDASQKARLAQEGRLTDEMILDTIVGDQSPVQIVGENGRPQYASPGAAVRTGAEPVINKGAEAKPQNGVALLEDGRRVPAIQRGDGKWRNSQNDEELSGNFQIFDMPKPQGSATDVGLSKPVNSGVEQQLIDIEVAKDTAVKLRDLIATAPASQGVVGFLRGTAQNFLAQGGEVANYFGGNLANVQERIAAGLEDEGLAGAFDTNIPTIEMMANLLAFQYAKTTTGERLSNEMLKQAREALGLYGLSENQQSSTARLNQAIKMIEAQSTILQRARSGGVDAITTTAPAAPAGQPVVPAAPAANSGRLRFDANGDPIR
jgi:hypothetical protein